MIIHRLKIHPQPFDDLLSGAKNNEVRNCSDRRFSVGDLVHLIEVVKDNGMPTGREAARTITHIQRGYGLPDDLCVLSYSSPSHVLLAARVEKLEALIIARANVADCMGSR